VPQVKDVLANLFARIGSPLSLTPRNEISPLVANRPDIVASVIGRALVVLTDHIPSATTGPYEFGPGMIPAIGLDDYIKRIAIKSKADIVVLIVALALLDRLIQCGAALTRTSVYRMYASCFVVAVKTLTDQCYRMEHYCRVTGINLQELVSLERLTVNLLNFKLLVTRKEWKAYARPIEALTAANSGDSVGDPALVQPQ
jgi:hypothetical protein